MFTLTLTVSDNSWDEMYKFLYTKSIEWTVSHSKLFKSYLLYNDLACELFILMLIFWVSYELIDSHRVLKWYFAVGLQIVHLVFRKQRGATLSIVLRMAQLTWTSPQIEQILYWHYGLCMTGPKTIYLYTKKTQTFSYIPATVTLFDHLSCFECLFTPLSCFFWVHHCYI